MIHVNIGEIKILKKSTETAWTTLGSCISIIFYSGPNLSTICHAQLPSPDITKQECSDICPRPCFLYLPDSNKFKFVNCTVEYMLNIFNKNRVPFENLSTSVIGGSSIIDKGEKEDTIGYKNYLSAKKILDKYDIKISRLIVGRQSGIDIWYYPENDRLVYREHVDNIKKDLKPGEIIKP